MHPYTIILEDSALELVPRRFWTHKSCKLYESRFGVPPNGQVLDDNFHHEIVVRLPAREKRARPDIVHFALLDIMSTPAYGENLIQPVIHTINNNAIIVQDGVRLPRTELRFGGIMSKILRNDLGPSEKKLFDFRGAMSTGELVKLLKPRKVICLSTQGVRKDLSKLVAESNIPDEKSTCIWVVGGFARGHFTEETKSLADEVISISNYQLPAHVVTARLSYEIEQSLLS